MGKDEGRDLGVVPFVLASASPRRKMLLDMIGLRHRVMPPTIEEGDFDCDEPSERVLRLAKVKATIVAGEIKSGIILGADTIVVKDGRILEKPCSRKDAVRMLSSLSDEWHEVYTGLHLIDAEGLKEVFGCEVTRVKFRSMDRREIDVYLQTGEPMDKAGSYGIQGFGAVFIDRVEGCYFNVVGLPLNRLMMLLKELGCFFDFRELRRM
ncbi:MAG: Maf family protein [Candidatus Glassbacteria bacterium]